MNDLNPLRTNFLNVIKTEPLKLIKRLLESDLSFTKQPENKNPKLSAYKKAINDYAEKHVNYHKVDCDIDIAYKMFIVQCIDKVILERAGKIIERVFRFLPAHLKLQNSVITQQDCLGYLKTMIQKNYYFWMCHTSVQSILVLLLITNISLSTRK
ncbi:MAG: hypothetical protein ACI4GW_08850 [Lachnospiraceae bacterium]